MKAVHVANVEFAVENQIFSTGEVDEPTVFVEPSPSRRGEPGQLVSSARRVA